jgi:hypothetical protein
MIEAEEVMLGVTLGVAIGVTLGVILGVRLGLGVGEGTAHSSVSLASMWKAAAVPTTKRVIPSEPVIWFTASVVQTPPGLICAHIVAGAITRSTRCGFAGCAAGQIWRPYEEGTARELAVLHVMDEIAVLSADEDVLPAVQDEQVPEHTLLVRPAWSPKVPAGQSEQAAAPARE